MNPAMGTIQSAQSASNSLARSYLFPPRFERFVTPIHLAGRFGSEGVQARIQAREKLVGGLAFEWAAQTAPTPLPNDLQALLERVVSARLAWRHEQNVKSSLVELCDEVLNATPSLILGELLCNAFDAHVRANRGGLISLNVFTSTDHRLVVDVSDDGIGIKSVLQDFRSLKVSHNDVSPNWIPFVEGEIGIGLLWSKLLAELHAGSIEFLKDVYAGQRTTVRISFPLGIVNVLVESASQ
jgi:signal transduction histidine kinase